MTLQREVNPLPPGRYWATLTGRPNALGQNAIQVFDAWQKLNSAIVKVEASDLDTSAQRELGPAGISQFTIFRVEAPAFLWDASQLGFPEFAPDSVKTREDAERLPDKPLDASETLAESLKSGGTLVALAIGAAFVLSLKSVFGALSKAKGPKL